MISVIVPIYNEAKHIEKCIQSILNQDYPKGEMEVIFVDGMSTDGTREIVNNYCAQYEFLRMEDNPAQIVPPAMNIGIRASRGEIIIRLDAHAIFPNNYFTELVRGLTVLGADNVGGVCRTLPYSDKAICRSIAAVLSSPFGMGNSYFRIGAEEVRQVDTVPFGCFHRDLFDRIGYFDEELIRNQDDEFNGRIIRNGGTIYLLPDLVIDYYARDTMRKVWSMFYQYGLFKPLVNKKLGSPATLRQFFPMLFVLGLVLGAALSWLHPIIGGAYIAVLALYLLLAGGISIRTAAKEHCAAMAFQMPAVFFVVHSAYGIGYIRGILKLLTHGNFAVKSRR